MRFSDKVEINEISCRKSTEDISKDSFIIKSPSFLEETDEIDNFIILENKIKEETKSKSQQQPSMIERIN